MEPSVHSPKHFLIPCMLETLTKLRLSFMPGDCISCVAMCHGRLWPQCERTSDNYMELFSMPWLLDENRCDAILEEEHCVLPINVWVSTFLMTLFVS